MEVWIRKGEVKGKKKDKKNQRGCEEHEKGEDGQIIQEYYWREKENEITEQGQARCCMEINGNQ